MIKQEKLVNLVIKKIGYVNIMYLNRIAKNAVVKYVNIIGLNLHVKNARVEIYVSMIK
jgi:hypothetical protein